LPEAEKAAIKNLVSTAGFLLPVPDRPAKIVVFAVAFFPGAVRLEGLGIEILASIEALVTYSLQQKLIPSRPQLDQVFVEIDP